MTLNKNKLQLLWLTPKKKKKTCVRYSTDQATFFFVYIQMTV